MSVYYYVREHLQVKRTAEEMEYITDGSIAQNIMQGQLAALAALSLVEEDINIYELHLTADGKEYTYEGSEITPEFRTILTALTEAADVDIVADYKYVWRANWEMYDLVGPFPLMNHCKEPENEDAGLNGVFYSAWHCADCSDGNGVLVAYGEKDGKTYNGEVPYETVMTAPDGNWYNPLSSVVYAETEEGKSAAETPGFTDACKAVSEFAEEELNLDEEGCYYLNNVTLHSDAEVKHFIELVKEVKRVSKEFNLIADFVDTSLPDVRLMIIDEEDRFAIRVASV